MPFLNLFLSLFFRPPKPEQPYDGLPYPELLPTELLSHILSFISLKDRLNVWSCSRTLAASVTSCDLIMPAGQVRMELVELVRIPPSRRNSMSFIREPPERRILYRSHSTFDITHFEKEPIEERRKLDLFISIGKEFKVAVPYARLSKLLEILAMFCNKVRAKSLILECDVASPLPFDFLDQLFDKFGFQGLHVLLNFHIPENLIEFTERYNCNKLYMVNCMPDGDKLLALPPMTALVGVARPLDDRLLLALLSQPKHRSFTVTSILLDPHALVKTLEIIPGGGRDIELMVNYNAFCALLQLFTNNNMEGCVNGSEGIHEGFSWQLSITSNPQPAWRLSEHEVLVIVVCGNVYLVISTLKGARIQMLDPSEDYSEADGRLVAIPNVTRASRQK